jgi:hypothetical protein
VHEDSAALKNRSISGESLHGIIDYTMKIGAETDAQRSGRRDYRHARLREPNAR